MNNVKKNPVFFVSAILAILFALWGIIGNKSLAKISNILMNGLQENFSWLYLYTMLFFVLFCVILAFSKYGKIRLGKDDERPEYSTISWFAMLFAAGMGIGLVYWGVAEPLSHYIWPMNGIESASSESIAFSMRSCFMHWGLHPWACYAVMGLGLAYFQFRKDQPTLVSSLLKPTLRERAWFKTVIDVFTVVLTVIGVATSFGMGCLQISSGLEFLFGIPNNHITWLILIIIIGCIFMKSATSGIGKGIKILSNTNLCLFVLLMIVGFLIGPMKDTVKLLGQGLVDYLVNFFPDSVRLSANGDTGWIRGWRVFYWAWWLSWAPFVGVFVARISKGRTIREFVMGAILVPTAVSIIWFSVFGGLTFHVTDHFSAEKLAEIAGTSQTTLFHIFAEYPIGIIISLIAMTLLIIFFITSADSATFVLAMLTTDGDLNPPNNKKIFWGILMAVIAFALILSGGISMIQTISIVIAFPFLFILILICINLVIALKKDISKK